MSASEWTDRNQRHVDADAEYELIMTTPAPPAMGAYIDAGVIGFVFGEDLRRGVLTPRDPEGPLALHRDRWVPAVPMETQHLLPRRTACT